jgi:hypothetical protein
MHDDKLTPDSSIHSSISASSSLTPLNTKKMSYFVRTTRTNRLYNRRSITLRFFHDLIFISDPVFLVIPAIPLDCSHKEIQLWV